MKNVGQVVEEVGHGVVETVKVDISVLPEYVEYCVVEK